MLKHFVRYIRRGPEGKKSVYEEIPERDLRFVSIMDSQVIGFQFFDKVIVEEDGEVLEGKEKNYSGVYYKGIHMTKEELSHIETIHATLILNAMGLCNLSECVKTGEDEFYLLHQNDVVLSEEQIREIIQNEVGG